jgi:hypothetical protein
MQRLLNYTALLVAAFACAALPARAQDNQGPMAPPPKFEVRRIPSVPHPGPPPIPEQEIIRKLSVNEDIAKKVYATYTFTQTIRVEELSDPGGKFTATGEQYIKPDGQRYWRVTDPPQSTLKFTKYTLEDVNTIVTMPLFFLTTDQVANYDFLYAGEQKLDEINAFVFQVKPKMLNRSQRFFQGVIFVDDHDLAIVETYGKFVSEFGDSETKLPFSLFETYRENFQQKYWLPTYTSSDDYIDVHADQPLQLRLVMHSTNFKLASATPNSTQPQQDTEPDQSPVDSIQRLPPRK